MVLFCAAVASAFMICLITIGVLALRNSSPHSRAAVAPLGKGTVGSGPLGT